MLHCDRAPALAIQRYIVIVFPTLAAVDPPIDAKRIARDHRVRYGIEGSVQRDGERTRINAQVIDGRSGAVVWAHRFDRERADDLAVQGEVATLIAQALNYRLVDIGPASGRLTLPRTL